MSNKWFANRGQAIQVLLGLFACIFAGVKAFPDFQRSQFFTIGSLLFIFIAAWVVVSIVQFGLTYRTENAKADQLKVVQQEPITFSEQHRGNVFSCSSGLSRIGKRTDGIWTPVGSENAAVATFKNQKDKALRNVSAFASFYDNKGRKIAFVRLPWIDEEEENTGFAVGGLHSLVVALQAKGEGKCFSLTDGQKLKEENISVEVDLSIDGGSGGIETIQFILSVTPYLGLTPVKP